jgi:DNA-binding transcriptional LysR family regulator
VMEDHAGDMIEEGLDLAVRSGEVMNLSLIKRSLGTVVRVAVATPDYLSRRGLPSRPADLVDHDCIVHRVSPNDSEWRLIGPGGAISVMVDGMVTTNNHEAVRAAALGGLGIGLLPEYQVVDDVENGRLARVLPEYTSETLAAYVVYPSRRHLALRTRVVIDFLIEEVHRLRSRRTDGGTSPEAENLLAFGKTTHAATSKKERGRHERRPIPLASAIVDQPLPPPL